MLTNRSIWTLALLAATVVGCGGSDGPTPIEIPITRIEIVLPSDCRFLALGDTCRIMVDAFSGDRLVGNPVLRWFSSDVLVATVNEDTGLVTTAGFGMTTITVTNSTGTASDQLEVTVGEPKPEGP